MCIDWKLVIVMGEWAQVGARVGLVDITNESVWWSTIVLPRKRSVFNREPTEAMIRAGEAAPMWKPVPVRTIWQAMWDEMMKR